VCVFMVAVVWPLAIAAIRLAVSHRNPAPRAVRARPAAAVAPAVEAPLRAREDLLAAIDAFKEAEARVGKASIDFGVKGGELDKNTRAPANLKEVWVPAVLEAAEGVERAIEALAPLSPTTDPTRLLGTVEGNRCPLDGAWRNLWTTAGDAYFSPNSTRGDAAVYNVIDGSSGSVTNFIDFASGAQFRVLLKATAQSATRVALRFRFVKISPPKPLLWGLIRTITIPVPGPFITRVLTLLRRGPKKPPSAYFDILYLDDEIRVHRTGQGNLFVQRRAAWSSK